MIARKVALPIVISTVATLLAGVALAADPAWKVEWKGRSSDVLAKSDIGANVPLLPLTREKHIYALGPIAGFKGEVTIWDSKPLLGQVQDGRPVLRHDADAAAIWLVWSHIERWKQVPLTEPMTPARLDELVRGAARDLGAAADAAIPFRIKGKLTRADLTITNYQHDGRPMTAEKLAHISEHFAVQDLDVDILGFWSAGHKGIFMPAAGNLHMHANTADAGYHIQDMLLASGATLFLPVE